LRVLVMLDRIFNSTLSAGILQAAQRATCRKKGCVEIARLGGNFRFLISK